MASVLNLSKIKSMDLIKCKYIDNIYLRKKWSLFISNGVIAYSEEFSCEVMYDGE